ncbi:hypothetical protein GQ54DRAFT_81264 [Martensiomyces pterosporus]|nr:hypothetical protein GQ54DRAFT_81264 [Martensiomyces pterosporus]
MDCPNGYTSSHQQGMAASSIQNILARASQSLSPAVANAAATAPSSTATLPNQGMPPADGSHQDITSSGIDFAKDSSTHTASDSLAKRRSINSSKRAAQNRAAQRAFRLRREKYVANLEEKARQYNKLEAAYLDLQKANYELQARLREVHAENMALRSRLASSSSISPSPSSAVSTAFSPTIPTTPIAGVVVPLESLSLPQQPPQDMEASSHLRHRSQFPYDTRHSYASRVDHSKYSQSHDRPFHLLSSSTAAPHTTVSPQLPAHHQHFPAAPSASSGHLPQGSSSHHPHIRHHTTALQHGHMRREHLVPHQSLPPKQPPAHTKPPQPPPYYQDSTPHRIPRPLSSQAAPASAPAHTAPPAPPSMMRDAEISQTQPCVPAASTSPFRRPPGGSDTSSANTPVASTHPLPSVREITRSIGSLLPGSPHPDRQAASSTQFQGETGATTPADAFSANDAASPSSRRMDDASGSRRRPW